MQWYLQALKNYAVFSGRSRRKEYWMFSVFNMLVGFCLGFIAGLTGHSGVEGVVALVTILYGLAVIIPGIALTMRRLHDTGRHGWWLLIVLVPIIGALVLLFFMVQDGNATQNEFGPNPKAAAA